MCSIITVRNGMVRLPKLLTYIKQEAIMNSDGFSLILQEENSKMTVIKTMSLSVIEAALMDADWHRMFLHMRAATQGATNVRNCHGWITKSNQAVMHNGILMDLESKSFSVDSELILAWVEEFGLDGAMELLKGEAYANVFVIDTVSGDYRINRTKLGTLYTDGAGNYSTNPVGRLLRLVPDGFQQKHESKVIPPAIVQPYNYNRWASWGRTAMASETAENRKFGKANTALKKTEQEWPTEIPEEKELISEATWRKIKGA